ncbi:di-N-acetylchitobiase isoform X2 [Phyllostomus discolor]|uniref:Di-N-acetylchitobiase isoform X2 n=1 Tax=Phyllostomus discolor TaxID=89673 RepID=A0A7E6DSW1_9CHIR|nr:di-N-acetylchitobiase isoform X2 [Phyllostomus discolor]
MSKPSLRLRRVPTQGWGSTPGIAPLLPLLLLLLPLQAGANCPCQDPALCQPIRKHPNFEVFVFDVGGKTWKSYDWSQITTVALFGKYDSELMCYAHAKGARVVLKGDVSLKDIIDPNFRASWIAQQVNLAKTQYMDGINIDIEQEVNYSTPEYDALTALVQETADAFHHEIEGSQVTFDVAWSPKCIDRRCYNYTGIADACDFLFVMSYDEQSQVWSECMAAANAPCNQTLTAYDDYIKMGINPKKLVMGLPWYGYDYTCLTLSEDSAGRFHQVWYDNPKSISLKATYTQTRGLRGIGMWNANCLDYSEDAIAKQQTEEMWKVLKPKL